MYMTGKIKEPSDIISYCRNTRRKQLFICVTSKRDHEQQFMGRKATGIFGESKPE
jgi:hypothetical protein